MDWIKQVLKDMNGKPSAKRHLGFFLAFVLAFLVIWAQVTGGSVNIEVLGSLGGIITAAIVASGTKKKGA